MDKEALCDAKAARFRIYSFNNSSLSIFLLKLPKRGSCFCGFLGMFHCNESNKFLTVYLNNWFNFSVKLILGHGVRSYVNVYILAITFYN